MSEKVLVFPTSLLNDLGMFTGFQPNVKKYLPVIFNSGKLSYLDRDKAENDPTYLQLIPYVVFVKEQNSEVFAYKRTKKGGESRLHDLYSVGVGGHVNPVDGEGEISFWKAYDRELREEVDYQGVNSRQAIGLIYDPSNDVGKVHFGVNIMIKCGPSFTMKCKDHALSNGQFEKIQTCRSLRDNFENWSQLVLDNLKLKGESE